MKKVPKITAIVPVYDEEKTVAKVVKTLLLHPKISEVICVDDGSEDKSFSLLKDFGKQINLISLKKNHGKGFTLAQGISHARGDIVIFVDADLIGLKKRHIDILIYPIIGYRSKAVLGYPVPNKYNFFAKSPLSI